MSHRRKVSRPALAKAQAAAAVARIRERILTSVPAGASIDPAVLDRFIAYWTTRGPECRAEPSSRVCAMGANCFGTDQLLVVMPGSCRIENVDELEYRTWAEFFADSDLGQEIRDYFDGDEDDEERFPPDEAFDPDFVREWLAEHRTGSAWLPQVVMGEFLPRAVLDAYADFEPGMWSGDFCIIALEDADAVALALADRGWLTVRDQGMTDLSQEPDPGPDDVVARLDWYAELESLADELPRIRGARPAAPPPPRTSAALQRRVVERTASDLRPRLLELQEQGVLDNPAVASALLAGPRALERFLQPGILERAAQATMAELGLTREEYEELARHFGG